MRVIEGVGGLVVGDSPLSPLPQMLAIYGGVLYAMLNDAVLTETSDA